jgi:hypothetical protein
MTKKKCEKKTYYTVGVRFLSDDYFDTVYTYRVRNRSKVSLGQELIAETHRGAAVVVVVRIDKLRQDTEYYEYKYLERKVVKL